MSGRLWLISVFVVTIGVALLVLLWRESGIDVQSARIIGLILAAFGIAFAVPFIKASSAQEYIKASLLFLVWLFVAIGFAIWCAVILWK